MEGSEEFEAGLEAFGRKDLAKAIRCWQDAQTAGYESDRCAGNRWYAWMLLGEFEQAWRESDTIAARGAPDPNRLWNGKPFSGGRLIVRCLHGYGDALQFLRYVPLIKQRAERVIVETHPEMVGVLSRLEAVDEVVSWGDGSKPKFEAWDDQVEVMELPRIFGTTLGTIPRRVPYLFPEAAAVRRSANLLGRGPELKVGLLWGSGAWNPARSMPFEECVPLLQVSGVRWYSFQRGARRDDLGSARGIALFDTSLHSVSILDTAADLMNMDLLITVDTMAAHLAGALGRPVWVLLPWQADWRWMLERDDSPWYPTMRLFRQQASGDWAGVIRRVLLELKRMPHLQTPNA